MCARLEDHRWLGTCRHHVPAAVATTAVITREPTNAALPLGCHPVTPVGPLPQPRPAGLTTPRKQNTGDERELAPSAPRTAHLPLTRHDLRLKYASLCLDHLATLAQISVADAGSWDEMVQFNSSITCFLQSSRDFGNFPNHWGLGWDMLLHHILIRAISPHHADAETTESLLHDVSSQVK